MKLISKFALDVFQLSEEFVERSAQIGRLRVYGGSRVMHKIPKIVLIDHKRVGHAYYNPDSLVLINLYSNARHSKSAASQTHAAKHPFHWPVEPPHLSLTWLPCDDLAD